MRLIISCEHTPAGCCFEQQVACRTSDRRASHPRVGGLVGGRQTGKASFRAARTGGLMVRLAIPFVYLAATKGGICTFQRATARQKTLGKAAIGRSWFATFAEPVSKVLHRRYVSGTGGRGPARLALNVKATVVKRRGEYATDMQVPQTISAIGPIMLLPVGIRSRLPARPYARRTPSGR